MSLSSAKLEFILKYTLNIQASNRYLSTGRQRLIVLIKFSKLYVEIFDFNLTTHCFIENFSIYGITVNLLKSNNNKTK